MPLTCRKKGRLAIYYYCYFVFSSGNRKQKQSYGGLKGWARVAGSLVLGAGAHGAEVFLAMQGCQHILTALVWPNRHSAIAVFISSSMSSPSMFSKR